jgi:hypothetical protein
VPVWVNRLVVRRARLPMAIALSLATVGAEASCAGFLDGFGRSDRPAVLRELSRAQTLVTHVLRESSKAPPRSARVVAVRRSQLVQLSSALSAAQAVAASDLNTDVKVQTLRADVRDSDRLAAALSIQAAALLEVDKTRKERPMSSPTLDGVTPLLMINPDVLQQLKMEIAHADRLAARS